MCDDAVFEDCYSLQYVFDWFVTQGICENMADDDYYFDEDGTCLVLQ